MAALQNVLDEPNKNTIFMVWNFHDNIDVKPAFQQLCGLIGNLNNSAKTRFPDAKASVVMGIGHDAWLRLDLPQPLPKELAPLNQLKVQNIPPWQPVAICISIFVVINQATALILHKISPMYYTMWRNAWWIFKASAIGTDAVFLALWTAQKTHTIQKTASYSAP